MTLSNFRRVYELRLRGLRAYGTYPTEYTSVFLSTYFSVNISGASYPLVPRRASWTVPTGDFRELERGGVKGENKCL